MDDRLDSQHSTRVVHTTPNVQTELDDVVAVLERTLGENLQQIMLYGSQARGDARFDSDVDLLVVVAMGTPAADDVVHRVTYDVMASHDFDALISALVVDEAGYEKLLAGG